MAEADCDREAMTALGNGGAGRFAAMVLSGLQCAGLQLRSEVYHLLQQALRLSADEVRAVFITWNQGEPDSVPVELSGLTCAQQAHRSAEQKTAAQRTVAAALDLGVPVTVIGEALWARCLPAAREHHIAASSLLRGPQAGAAIPPDRAGFIENVRRALDCSTIIAYAQAGMLLRAAAKEHGWQLNWHAVAQTWPPPGLGHSRFRAQIEEAYDRQPELDDLLGDSFFAGVLSDGQASWRKAVVKAIALGIPTPALSSALAFYDGCRAARRVS